MDIKVQALTLKSVDYKENDKRITIFTVDKGKLTATVKGVKKAAAKLKFCTQPFSFAELVLAERHGIYTVTNAYGFESYYELTNDINKLYAGFAVCEYCDKQLFEGMVNERLFLLACSTLKELCTLDERYVLVRFLVKACELSGYAIDYSLLGSEAPTPMFFDFEKGEFTAERSESDKQTDTVLPASPSAYAALRRAQYAEYDRALDLEDGVRRALKLLTVYLEFKTDIKVGSLHEFIKLT